jgi:hypothetical protein
MMFKTSLVLTKEFCETTSKKGTWGINQEKFPIGKTVCEQLEPSLKKVFPNLVRVESEQAAEGADLVLVPQISDVGATQKAFAFSKRELVVMVAWTARDKAGKTVWVETVQGEAKHNIGNAFTHGHDVKLIVHDAVEDMADQSAKKMSDSPEIRKIGN